ncbi:MAG: hypothetical protein QNJ15_06560 [Erythrobacter sp.]|nr:hypothetical protein [Erythrobacter sp.]
MKKFTTLAILGAASVTLAACGNAEDASVEATADTVEMPADDALQAVTDEPVEDAAATEATGEEGTDATAAVSQEDAEAAADDAASIAEQVEAAAAEAEAAANAVDSAADAVSDAAENVDQ